ncbi:dihydroorotate dehydrogenase electron transfer subunit [Paenalcaligenes hominis]|uniref:dihydroorotate dehydrogenase electron transfer subunit n=1 Tax=Paenalcaligenes hominis TaxID=643674 RepID=UPI003524C6BB
MISISCHSKQKDSFSIVEQNVLVLSNEWVNDEYKKMTVTAPAPTLAALPGQFFHLLCPPSGENLSFLRRPMSIHGVNQEANQLEFLYKVQGTGTRNLAALTRGEQLNLLGPLGQGFSLSPSPKHALLLGRGVGLATLTPLAAPVIKAGGKVTAVLSVRRPDLIMAHDTLSEAGATVYCVNDTDQSSDVNAVRQLLEQLHAKEPFDFLTTCGSNRLTVMLQQFGKNHQLDGQVALEQHMGCALGMCFACVLPLKNTTSNAISYQRVCLNGPVFDLQEVLA